MSPERASTDGSLRAEREKTDAHLSSTRAVLEAGAVDAVARARDQTDVQLQVARDRADSGEAQRSGQASAQVEHERALSDLARQTERTKADQESRNERRERQRALDALLRKEREDTNDCLLSERERSDEVLESRDNFLAMVSHDLRSQLGTVALALEVMLRDDVVSVASPTLRVSAEQIQRATARMGRIIGDLMDFTSMQAGKLAIERRREDVVTLVRETVGRHRARCQRKQIALALDLPAGPVWAELDRGRIEQVLDNLLANSTKFCSGGGHISVALEVRTDEWELRIVDSGCGIPADQLETIFARFWQAGRRDRRGLGLGLYISRSIIEEHGGKIWAESQFGHSTTLVFTLPRDLVEADEA